MAASILVVEDDPNMRQLLAIHLRNAGYDVRTAEDGVEAGYGVLQVRPDLIISDVNMPHLDGFEFVAAMRAEAALRDIPVIFLTSAEEGEFRGKELGAVEYVSKPVRADRLLSLVARHVSGGRHPIG
jgi:DNA-binding response OmpR family regulator